MPEAVNGARYACQKCVNGHRTKTCQHWENEHKELVRTLNIDEVAPGASPDNIAVFAKTKSAGRPKAADLEKDRKGTTLYILLKTTNNGKESCKAIGEIDIDAEGNKKETRKSCCSKKTPPATLSCHSRAASTTTTSSRKRPLDSRISDISYETTTKNAKHECKCGTTCTCRFCPQHPNTQATQDVMRQVAQQVKEQYRFNQESDGQLEFTQPFQSMVPCGGGQITGANSQFFATDDPSLLDSWKHQQDGSANYITTIPIDFAASSYSSPDPNTNSLSQVQSPQDMKFSSMSSPSNAPLPLDFHSQSSFTPLDDFSVSSQYTPEIDSSLLLDGWTEGPMPQAGAMNDSFQNPSLSTPQMYASDIGTPIPPANAPPQGRRAFPALVYQDEAGNLAISKYLGPFDPQMEHPSMSARKQVPVSSMDPISSGFVHNPIAQLAGQEVFGGPPVPSPQMNGHVTPPSMTTKPSCCGGGGPSLNEPPAAMYRSDSQPQVQQGYPAHRANSLQTHRARTHTPNGSLSSPQAFAPQMLQHHVPANGTMTPDRFDWLQQTQGVPIELDSANQFWQQPMGPPPLNHNHMPFPA